MTRTRITPLLAVLAIAATATAAHGVATLWKTQADNTKIAMLAQGRDIPAAAGADASLLASRALFLLKQGRTDDVKAIEEHMTGPGQAPLRAILLYDLGNDSLRQAMQIYMQVPLRQVKPLINAAKADYRESLQLDPADWDCRYNFALASTLIRDTETSVPMLGAQMSHDKATYPDIPGAPNGMP